MKVQIRDAYHKFYFVLPTNLIFHQFLLRLGLKHMYIEGSRPDALSGDAIDRLCAEIQRIQKLHGAWELVEVRSADGKTVKVTL